MYIKRHRTSRRAFAGQKDVMRLKSTKVRIARPVAEAKKIRAHLSKIKCGAALMSQRDSGYERKPLDQYETPAWVTLALIPHLPVSTGKVWEPARGSGKMIAALREAGFDVVGSDITHGVDFLRHSPETGVSAITTNPPYALAREFIERAGVM
jgi:hypothetical protein